LEKRSGSSLPPAPKTDPDKRTETKSKKRINLIKASNPIPQRDTFLIRRYITKKKSSTYVIEQFRPNFLGLP
jgi:hypothetical protein